LSSESSSFRIDWRPSQLFCAALVCLGLLAALSFWLSALPAPLRIVCALLASAHGFWLARREYRRPACSLLLSADGSRLVIDFGDGLPVLARSELSLRGPLAALTGRSEDGRRWRFHWWPDTLPVEPRRALRLVRAKTVAETGPGLATMRG
jgi:toxin CptA